MRKVLAVLALVISLQPPGLCACGAAACCAEDDDHCASAAEGDHGHVHGAPHRTHDRHAPGCPAVTSGTMSGVALRACAAPIALSLGPSLTPAVVPPASPPLLVTTIAERFSRPLYLIVRALLL